MVNSKFNKKVMLNLAKVFLCIFAVTVIPQNIGSLFSVKETKAASNPIFGENYQVVNDITWSRTKDVDYSAGFKVNNTLLNNGSSGSDKFNTTNYWNYDGSTYYLNKIYNPQEGILWMPEWFPKTGTMPNIKFDYNTLLTYLNPTQTTNVWDGKGSDPFATDRVQKLKNANGGSIPTNFPDFSTWTYCKYGSNSRYGDQLRLFRGTFNLTQDDIDNYNFFITSGDNLDMILPIDDTMVVLVDGEPTQMNFTSAVNGAGKSITIHNSSKAGDDGQGNYNVKLKLTSCTDSNNADRGYKADCTDPNHAALSAFTDGLHAHLDLKEDGKTIGEISSILESNSTSKNSSGTYSHKIEILCSDYYLSGGMTKLQIVKVKKPKVEAVKEAYFNDGQSEKLVASGSSTGTSGYGEIAGSGTLYYKLKYINEGTTTVKDIAFTDNDLNVNINQSGYSVNNQPISDLSTLKITKGSTTLTGTDALSLLSSLAPGETVTVSDTNYLKRNITGLETNLQSNTVVVNSKYIEVSETEPKQAKVDIKVNQDIQLSVDKSIFSITRDGKEIYSQNSGSSVPRVYVGDKIIFKFHLKNAGITEATGLSLEDLIKKKDGTELDKGTNWSFKDGNGNNITANSFNLPGKSEVDYYSSEWTVPSGARYITTNYINLYQTDSSSNRNLVATDNVDFTVYPRVYVNMKCPSDVNQEFYVRVIGTDSSGKNVFTTAMYMKDGDKVEINNLDFGVEYKVVETIPMNCTLEGIDINGTDKVTNNLSFNLMDISDPSEITLYNSKQDSKNFRDDDIKTNNVNFSSN